MGKTKKDNRKFKNMGMGHEYGAGRAPEVHKDKRRKREKQKLKSRLKEWY